MHVSHSQFSQSPAKSSNLLMPRGIYGLVIVILMCATTIIVMRNTGYEKEQMLASMKGKADVLMWALEGTARTVGHMGQSPLPSLLVEVAKQPNVSYIAIVNSQGVAKMHSDTAKIGATLPLFVRVEDDKNNMSSSLAQFVWVDGVKVYEVIKQFVPDTFARPGNHMGKRGGHNSFMQIKENDYIVIGIDSSDFDRDLQAYFWHTVLMAALTVLAGVAATAVLFIFKHYKLSRQMLEDTQVLATQVVSNLPVGLIVTTPEGNISLCNAHSQSMLNFSYDSSSELTLRDIPVLQWDTLIAELDTKHTIWECEVDMSVSKTKIIPVSISATVLTDRDGGKSGYLFILRDLGEVRRLQKQVKLNERLSALGNMAAGVAHEIRNPLSSIKGYATYLTEKVKDDKMAYATGNILIQETERLNRVVSDLLSVARPLTVHAQPAFIAPLLQQAMRLIEVDAAEHRVSVELVLPQVDLCADKKDNPCVEQQVLIDADRLTQALLNLLVNAVQATEPGGTVTLTLEEAVVDERNAGIAISVSDTGCGMSAKALENLFTPYFTTKADGTGLGLTITQQIVEQHGGEIKVYSQPGKGTTFTILLPFVDKKGSNL